MNIVKKIFASKITLIAATLISFAVSCRKEKPPTHTVYMSPEFMNYFVNYDPGTCWVYKDSLNRIGLDTVQLVSRQISNFDDGGGTLFQGFIMHYTSNRSISFEIWAQANRNNGNVATLYPSISGEGTLEAIYNGSTWTRGSFYDSLPIASGKVYHNVVKMGEGCPYFNNMRIAKDNGIVAYNSNGAFYLVAKFKK